MLVRDREGRHNPRRTRMLQEVPPQPSRATHWTLPQKKTSLNLRQQQTLELRMHRRSSLRGLGKRASLGDCRQSLGMVAFSLLSKASRTELQAVYLHQTSSTSACCSTLLADCASDMLVGPSWLIGPQGAFAWRSHKIRQHMGSITSISRCSMITYKRRCLHQLQAWVHTAFQRWRSLPKPAMDKYLLMLRPTAGRAASDRGHRGAGAQGGQ